MFYRFLLYILVLARASLLFLLYVFSLARAYDLFGIAMMFLCGIPFIGQVVWFFAEWWVSGLLNLYTSLLFSLLVIQLLIGPVSRRVKEADK